MTLAFVAMSMQAQAVTFISEGFEAGVKAHLGLNSTDEVMQSQTDTITSIDMSGREIVDISDVAYLPNLTWINLSENKIEDVTPLASLEHIHYVNLSRNALESINPLAFACTDSLHVNVADNYIQDYNYLFSVTSCQLQLEGMGAQQVKNAPYFDVYQLYADVDEDGMTKACWRGYTNMEADVTLKCGTLQVAAQMDGYTNSVALPELDATMQVVLSNGETGDTTYVVPPSTHIVKGGDEVTIDTQLPESYQIGYLRALHGTVEADGLTLHYMAPSSIVVDTLYMSYCEGNRIRGFTQLYIMSQEFLGDANGDGKISITDAVYVVNYVLQQPEADFNAVAADVNGDGNITITDAVMIVNMILNGGTKQDSYNNGVKEQTNQ